MNKIKQIMIVMLLLLCGANTVSAEVLSTTFYHNDALGSPVAATDEAGNLKWRENYHPYGDKVDNDPAAADNSRWYTSHPHDKETGLTYAGARYYDPVIGRFMGIDPVGFVEGNVHSFNRFAYGNNNPYLFVDPDGRYPLNNRFGDRFSNPNQLLDAGYGARGLRSYDGMAFREFGAFIKVPNMSAAASKGVGSKVKPQSNKDVVTKGVASVPGRVQSRINLSNDGIGHTLSTHLNPARAGNKSQFTLSESELRSLLSSKSTVQAPAQALETGNFARTITTNRTVGNLADKMGGGSTNTFTVITDKLGNLQTAFPGGL